MPSSLGETLDEAWLGAAAGWGRVSADVREEPCSSSAPLVSRRSQGPCCNSVLLGKNVISPRLFGRDRRYLLGSTTAVAQPLGAEVLSCSCRQLHELSLLLTHGHTTACAVGFWVSRWFLLLVQSVFAASHASSWAGPTSLKFLVFVKSSVSVWGVQTAER